MSKPSGDTASLKTTDPQLSALARRAADEVHSGMVVGLGSGSTAEAVVRELGARFQDGLAMTGVPTSERTARLAAAFSIPLLSLDSVAATGRPIDIGLDGADEIAPNLDATKGRGGALLYEKLVALLCVRFVLVAASAKLVDQLGTRLPLPVEVIPTGWETTKTRLAKLGLTPTLRRISIADDPSSTDGPPYVTDGGHFILDCATGPIADPFALAEAIKRTTGVVDHGLFLGIADAAIIAEPDGMIRELKRLS